MLETVKISFPADTGFRVGFYKIYYRFLLDIFHRIEKYKENNLKLSLQDLPPSKEKFFVFYVNTIPVGVDFYDDTSISIRNLEKFRACLKFHYLRTEHSKYENLFPTGPVSFYDWEEYERLSKEIVYTANGDVVLNNQRPRKTATERRLLVGKILRDKYLSANLDIKFYKDQLEFWRLINDCLVSVCVPGARNDILDRGQFQYMALGCCTISPKLSITLAFNQELKSGVHYVECKSDYSDLVDRIEECRADRKKCVEIGQNAKILFRNTSTPEKLWEWMLKCFRESDHG